MLNKETLQKEIDDLGIINIEASNDQLTSNLLTTALEATRLIHSKLNYEEIARRIKENRKRYLNENKDIGVQE